MRGILNVRKISKKFPRIFQSSSHRHEVIVTAKAYFGTKSINIFMLIYYTLMYHTSLWYFSKNIIYLKLFNTVYSLLLCESEPVSDHPYLQIQAQAKRHFINYLCVHSINVKMLCESEPVSDHPYLSNPSPSQEVFNQLFMLHPINVKMSVILIHKCVDIIQLHFSHQ